ncbi:MAG: phosphoglycerate dehydrogenase [Aliarcobacter butzleri]|nr:phosphoglycerate dehydrogenase [Aliarcobacter butzleri]
MKIAVTSKSFSKNKVLINELSKYFDDIKLNHATRKLNDDELIEFLKDCDGVIVALEDINKKVLDALPKLKVISKFGVGLDNIDLNYCKIKNIKIGWIAGVNKQSVAEMTLGFMLMLIRNLYISSFKLSLGNWDKNGGYSLYGKTIGIIGVGHIGKEIIKLLKPFRCNILVNDIINQDNYYKDNNLIKSSKDDIFKNSDIITLHLPLTDDTHHIINKDTLKLMNKKSFIINTARGDLINLNDLKYFLQNNLIAGAAIDVYAEEPPDDIEFLGLQNLICTPHIGGNSNEAVLAMGISAIDKLVENTRIL